MPAPKSFAEATGPSGREATKTLTGKTIADLKTAVQKEWDGIVFEKDGAKIEHKVTLDTDEGVIEIEFYPDVAPNHARSFIALAKAGFYDGLIFHRCIPGFVIQGGCPVGDGTGGPGYQLKQEFNDKPHVRGVLSMARSTDVNSGGSQFFICHDTASFLDKQYTVFGMVTKGLDVVDRIVNRPRGANDRPKQPVTIKSAKATAG